MLQHLYRVLRAAEDAGQPLTAVPPLPFASLFASTQTQGQDAHSSAEALFDTTGLDSNG